MSVRVSIFNEESPGGRVLQYTVGVGGWPKALRPQQKAIVTIHAHAALTIEEAPTVGTAEMPEPRQKEAAGDG